MPRKEVVGEAGEPYLRLCNTLRQGAGVWCAFEAKELFRASPVPPPPPGALAGFLSAAEFGFDGFAQEVRLVLAGFQGGGDARQRAGRQRRNDLVRITHLPAHLRAGIAYGVSLQDAHVFAYALLTG